jgi:flagellar biosynthetic protein FliR
MVNGLLVWARCVGFLFRAPGFSHPSVPASLRAGLAVALALVLIPGRNGTSHELTGIEFAIALLVEFGLGSAIGMTASLIYDGAYAGGRVVDDYVGVKAIAPSLQLVAPSGFGRVWSLAFTGGFFLSGADRLVLLGFAQSFSRIPAGSPLHASGWSDWAATFAATIVITALQVAAPAVACAFVVQIAVGAISRVIPRFGSFTLAFPLAFAAALVATVIAMPVAFEHAPSPLVAVPPSLP